MAHSILNRLMGGVTPIVILFISLLISLFSLSTAMENLEPFAEFYFILLAINVIGVIVLVGLIGRNILSLIRQYRNAATGSRLTVRLIFMFVMLVLIPVSLVYFFSLQFIQRGIDSWFDVRIGKAFNSAIEMSQTAVTEKKRTFLHQTLEIRDRLALSSPEQLGVDLDRLRQKTQASEIALFGPGGSVVAMSGDNPNDIAPSIPDEWMTRLALDQGSFVQMESDRSVDQAKIRILLDMSRGSRGGSVRLMQAVFLVTDRIDLLSRKIEDAYTHYNRLIVLHEPLKFSFVLTLTMVLILSVLAAIWVAFHFARSLVAPIRMLAIGTRVVASGDYDKRLPRYGDDEIGSLVDSFNEMTRRIALARDEVNLSHQLMDRERAYLRTVLGNLASGVMTLDNQGRISTINSAASQILSVDLGGYIGRPFASVVEDWPDLVTLVQVIQPFYEQSCEDWHSEVVLFGASGRRVLTCGGAALPKVGDESGGYVIVFDDVTKLVQAQRDAAWGEVARRLAHEIKNPLTPIQLSAERLRRHYMPKMSEEERGILDRSTHTIIQQVEVMKELVKAFAEYARTPQLKLLPSDLNEIIRAVCDLYPCGDRLSITFALSDDLPGIKVDSGRIRQLIHNLIKNSIEAADGDVCKIGIETLRKMENGMDYIQMTLSDNGPGIPEEDLGRIFEPYVTAKKKGSGLGLPIVKKIVEEHGGVISGRNIPGGGACFEVRLPLHMDPGVVLTSGGEVLGNL